MSSMLLLELNYERIRRRQSRKSVVSVVKEDVVEASLLLAQTLGPDDLMDAHQLAVSNIAQPPIRYLQVETTFSRLAAIACEQTRKNMAS